PEFREALARLRWPAAGEAVGQHHGVHGSGGCSGNSADREPPVLEQIIEHAPGERAVRAAALQREIDALRVGGRTGEYGQQTTDHRGMPRSGGCSHHEFCLVSVFCRPSAVVRYCAVHPPSMERLAPVICDAASEHRNTTSAAIWSTVTNCLVGCAASSTSLITCSLVRLRACMVSGICFSTSGVHT